MEYATIDDFINILESKRCSNIDYLDFDQNLYESNSGEKLLFDHKLSKFNSCSNFPGTHHDVNSNDPINFKIDSRDDLKNHGSYKKMILGQGVNGIVNGLYDEYYDLISMVDKISTRNVYEPYHEGAIGLILNKMRKYLPNFIYTFGVYNYENKNHLCQEYIDGKTFTSIQHKLNNEQIISIFIQVANALNLAYDLFKFNHFDLHQDNLMIKILDYDVNIPIYSKDTIKYHKTNVIAIMIDYGYSRLEYKNKIYSKREPNFTQASYNSVNPKKYHYNLDLHKLIMESIMNTNKRIYNDIFKILYHFYDDNYIQEYRLMNPLFNKLFETKNLDGILVYNYRNNRFKKSNEILNDIIRKYPFLQNVQYNYKIGECFQPPKNDIKLEKLKRKLKSVQFCYPSDYINTRFKNQTYEYFIDYFNKDFAGFNSNLKTMCYLEKSCFEVPIYAGYEDYEKILEKYDISHFSSLKRESIVLSYKRMDLIYLENGEILIDKIYNNKNDSYHEAVVGIILNKLRKYIPNFIYTYGVYNYNGKYHISLEYFKSETFWEMSQKLTSEELKSVVIQLANALNLASKYFEFNHFDLYNNNIIIQRLDNNINIPIYMEDVIKYHNTNLLVKIIDFEYSRLKYKGLIYSKDQFESELFGINLSNFYHMIDIHYFIISSLSDENRKYFFEEIFGFYDDKYVIEFNKIINFIFQFEYLRDPAILSDVKDKNPFLVNLKYHYDISKCLIPPYTELKLDSFIEKINLAEHFLPAKLLYDIIEDNNITHENFLMRNSKDFLSKI